MAASEQDAIDTHSFGDIEIVEGIADQEYLAGIGFQFLEEAFAVFEFAVGEMVVQADDFVEPGADLEIVEGIFQGVLGVSREQRLGAAGECGDAEDLLGAGKQTAIGQTSGIAGVIFAGDIIERLGLEIESDLFIKIQDGEVKPFTIALIRKRCQAAFFEHLVQDGQAVIDVIQKGAVPIPDEMLIC